MNRAALLTIFVIFQFSCASTIHINQYAAKKDFKIIRITNLSIFNGYIKYSNSALRDEKHKETFLLYKNDTLKFIAPAAHISEKDPYLFKFQKINDSVSIISREIYGRYYQTDSSLFSNNYCLRKITVYPFDRISKHKDDILSGVFTIYHFENGNLIYQSKSISHTASQYSESLHSFFNNLIHGSIFIKPYATVPYSNEDSTKLNFFTSIFW